MLPLSRFLQREPGSEALYDLQDASRVRICRTLRRALLLKGPRAALSPALASSTQRRPRRSAVASGARQVPGHARSARRGTFTDSQTHGRTPAGRSGDVIQ